MATTCADAPGLDAGVAAAAQRHSAVEAQPGGGCEAELGVELEKTQQTSDWSGKLSEEQILYAAKDVEILMDLDLVFDKKLQAAGLAKAYVMECRAMPAMAQMCALA